MEKRKNSLSTLKICRFCLSDDSLTSLYESIKKPNKPVPLALKILSCLSVEVFPSDKMPSYICMRCNFFMDLFYEFKQICRRADERILQYIQNGTALETLEWPSSLTNMFHFGFRSLDKKPQLMKTVVQGGATVQVTSHEMCDLSNSEEEDEENVYNIKIGDGTPEGAKCIKVVASKNDSEDKEVTKPGHKGTESPRFGEYGCWPCDECDCTYPLEQLRAIHKKQKHRARTVHCDQCDAKFFSKYDLVMHLLRHSDEMPFQCVACDRKFKRLGLLKRHEKMMHSDIPQLQCPNCPATFLSLEELEAHQRRHVRHSERKHACPVCEKKFHLKTTLQRHMILVHDTKPAFSCEYCPAQFKSVTKLKGHVRSHAGDRPYPCKYCAKSFTKSHHYTRHLRIKHREATRSGRGACGQSDQYRCEQCDVCFTTQDELIYHSAIHATQNLTCPLCQEKFENVDAVTAHIKSHVNGTEFMCDLCELVFTTKEKLDSHLTVAHADEIATEEQDESSVDIDEEYEDDNSIDVKEEDGEMVVEIKKTDNYMLPEAQPEAENKVENTNSEESEGEVTYTELSTVDALAFLRKGAQVKEDIEKKVPEASKPPVLLSPGLTITKVVPKISSSAENQTASILRKAEEVKRKAQQTTVDISDKKEKSNSKVESNSISTGASDKSLRLLEKELQELKRTNTRPEVPKAVTKPVESLRNRRPQLFTSTPKARTLEEKKSLASIKSPAVEKKQIERKVVIKEPKETKEIVKITVKEEKEKEVREKEVKEKEIKEKEVKEKEVKEKEIKEKEVKEKEIREKEVKEKEVKEVKEKEAKEKETPKSVVKNGTNEKSQPEEAVRRSTRPSKIKDYAKMIRDRSQVSTDDDTDDGDDEEYKDVEKVETPTRGKMRRVSVKSVKAATSPASSAATTPATTPVVRKRGRPRKDQSNVVPPKVKKDDNTEEEAHETEIKAADSNEQPKQEEAEKTETKQNPPEITDNADKKMETDKCDIETDKSPSPEQKMPAGLLVSPTGQTLKKVPIKALPPGIKPLPLPAKARPMGPGELCEMQIGKKVVKVQKIVMTKAEVEAMAKKGLVEMKDGTMVLKQGIKIPTSESLGLRTTVVGNKAKESLRKAEES